jgi:hypothetical protein
VVTELEYAKGLFRAACDSAYEATYLPAINACRRITQRDELLYLALRAFNNAELLYEDARVELWSEAQTRAAFGYHGGYES